MHGLKQVLEPLLKIDFFIDFLMPLIGALSVVLVYIFGKKLFNEKVGIISAILFSFIPLHVFYSGRLLTEVLFTFFALLTFISFWKGYEEGKNKYKVLFGIFLALALLSRYTALWIMPVFFIYLLIRGKSFEFLKDRYLWYSVLAFFLVSLPLFIYGFLQYGNPFGAFIHGFKASTYFWGRLPWHFFFDYWLQMFSAVGIIFLIALFHIFHKKNFIRKEIYLLLLWFFFFLGMAILMPYKEDRFIIPIIPAIALISGYFIDKIKKYKRIILIAIIIISLLSLSVQFYLTHNDYYTDKNKCFLEGNKFLENVNKNSVIITEESTFVYYYTKLETRFYPNPWSYETIKNWAKSHYSGKDVYVLFGDYIEKPDEEYKQIKNDLEENSEKVFACSKAEVYSVIYKI